MYFTDGLRSEEMGFSRVFIEYFLRIQCQFIYERMFCLINIYHVRELGCGMGSVLKEILQKVSLRRCFGKPSLRFLDQTRCWISFWFPALFIVDSSLLVTCERKLKLWRQTRHIDGGRPLCNITYLFLSHQLEKTRSRQGENAKGKSPLIAGWGMWLSSSVAVKWCTEECP